MAGLKPRLDRDHLGGELFRNPFVRRDVIYPNSLPTQSNFNAGRARVKADAIASKGQVVLLGQSFGARIIASLLNDAEMLEKCPPSRCVVVLTGYPDRKYGGASTVQYSGIVAGYDQPAGVPDDCQYRVWDVARQYGAAEDYPSNRSVRAAVTNASLKVHEDYTAVRMGDPWNTVWADPENPNVTYILSPTYPLYKIDKSWYSLQRKADLDDEQRPEVERGYSRPFPAPKTRINRYFSSERGWDADQRRTVQIPPSAPFRPFG